MKTLEEIESAVELLDWFLEPAHLHLAGLTVDTDEARAYTLGLNIMHDALVWAGHLGCLVNEHSDKQIRDQFAGNLARLRQCLIDAGPIAVDYHCKVCGVECDQAPDPPKRILCPEHCEDHDYQHVAGFAMHCCVHCGQEAPIDWYED